MDENVPIEPVACDDVDRFIADKVADGWVVISTRYHKEGSQTQLWRRSA